MSDIDETDLEIWKTVVTVQMHFNDLALRIRNFAILSLGATITVAGYSLREGSVVNVWGAEVPFASMIIIIGVIVWLCFWYMDRHWYHRLLLGSVIHAMKIESAHKDNRPSLCLSETIKENSPYKFLGRKVRSHHRLDFFYWTIAVVLLVVAFAMFSITFSIFIIIISTLLGWIIYFFTTEAADKT